MLISAAVLVIGFAGAGRLLSARSLQLPARGQLPAFQLADERGAQITNEALRGKVSVVNFIFTSCSTACPLLSTELARLQAEVRSRGLTDRVRLWSISVDPERDTAERLRVFAARYGADPALWRFLRGDEAEIRRVVVGGMKQDVTRQIDRGEADGFTVLHGTKLVLVDGEARIRGYYEAKDPASMQALSEALVALADGRVELEPEIVVPQGAP